MGDDDEGLLEALAALPQQAHDLGGVAGVEVARGLVGEDDGRGVHEGAGDGDALLLTSGELAGEVVHAPVEPEGVRELSKPVLVHGAAVEEGGQRDVLPGAEDRDQVVELVDEADLATAEDRELLVGASVDVLAHEPHGARGGAVDAAHEVQQGRLARSG